MTLYTADLAGAKPGSARAAEYTVPVDRTLSSASLLDSALFAEMKSTAAAVSIPAPAAQTAWPGSLRAAPAPRTAALPPHRKPTIITGTVTLGRSERRTNHAQNKNSRPGAATPERPDEKNHHLYFTLHQPHLQGFRQFHANGLRVGRVVCRNCPGPGRRSVCRGRSGPPWARAAGRLPWQGWPAACWVAGPPSRCGRWQHARNRD